MSKKGGGSIDPNFDGATDAEQGNVRIKLSTWLTSIVDEVRRKSSAPLQKWTEATTSQCTAEATYSRPSPNKALNILDTESQNSFASQENPQQLCVKNSILRKFNGSHDGSSTKKSQKSAAIGQFTSLGRVKISQFYDKARYNFLQSERMDKSGNITNTMLKDIESDATMESNENMEKNPNLAVGPSEDSLNISLENQDFSSFTRKLTLGDIGRSSTNKTSCSGTNATRSFIMSSPKNIMLGAIGRSFSEQTDEDDEYTLNERSRSFTHVINNRIYNQSNSANNNNVSTSLPSFFENKCISPHPIAVKKHISRETSLSDSPRRSFLMRDSSIQSDSSHCSSVESLLEARKPDPEAILINLGFGPAESEDILSRIPKRFLKPSQVRGIDTEAFLRRQQMASHLHDHSVLGYRGLVGNPDIPPSMIVAKIMERFEMNERNRCIMDLNINRPQSAPPTPGPST